METRIRIYVADIGKCHDVEAYEFIVEFADEQLAGNYVHYMLGKHQMA